MNPVASHTAYLPGGNKCGKIVTFFSMRFILMLAIVLALQYPTDFGHLVNINS